MKRLMSITQVAADRTMKPGEYPPLEIRFSDGRAIERHVQFAKGAPENPLADEELHHKVVSQVEPVLGQARCRELIACVEVLETVPDFRELTRLLVR